MKFMKYWLPVVAWMGAIFIFSSQHSVTVSEVFFVQFAFFKMLHLIEYSLLYVLLYRALRNTTRMPEREVRIYAFVYAVFYGVNDEIHQVFVPSREGRLRDVGIDAIGIGIAAFILWKYVPQAPKTLKIWAKKLQLIS